MPRTTRTDAVTGSRGSPVAVVLALAAFFPGPCHAQAAAATLTVAWSEFAAATATATAAASDTLDAVAVLVPRQLASRLSYVTTRFITPDEMAAANDRQAVEQLESARDSVAKARAARDLVALSTADPALRAASLATADAAVGRAERSLADLLGSARPDSTLTDSTPAATRMPLTMLAADGSGKLLAASDNPAQSCASSKADMLVHGSVRMAGSFVAIDAALYIASIGRDVWQATEYAAADGIDGAVAALARPLAEAMLGRPFALVRYTVSPVNAELAIDGTVRSGAFDLFFEAATHDASGRAPGYVPRSVKFYVEPGDDRTVAVSLDPLEAVAFNIASDPAGARVHVDGALIGSTPVEVPAAAYPRVGRISMPGYDDVQIIIRPDVILDDRNFIMVPSDGSAFDARLGTAKDRFYRSLGWFVVSLPLPVISGGLFQTYYQTASQYVIDHPSSPDPAVIDSLNTRYYGWQAAFWASTAVSAGLAINAVMALISYIHTAR